MKNRFRSLLSVLLVLVLLLSCGVTSAQAAGKTATVKVDVNATFNASEARNMLDLINDFRTGKDANYIDKDNKTTVKVKDLKKLKYDYELERVAMLRALEIAVFFSHTRPNGGKWSEAHNGSYTKGENIAYGFGSAAAAFKAFREDGKNYAGQGHRRNMLQEKFTRVGFGCVKVGNMVYWAQEFGSGSVVSKSPQKNPSKTVEATWEKLTEGKTKISVSEDDIEISVGETIAAPKVILASRSGAKNTLRSASWKSSKSNVVEFKSSKLTGLKEGTSTLSVKVNGTTLKVNVDVVANSNKTKITIDEYNPPLGIEETEIFFLDDEEVGFLEEDSGFEEGDE